MTVRVVPWKKDKSGPTRWWIDIRFRRVDGTKVRDRVVHEAPTVTMARRWGAARETQLRDGSLNLTKREAAPTWDEFFPRYQTDATTRLAASSVNTSAWVHRVWLSPAFGSLPLDHITDERLSQLRARMLASPGKRTGSFLSQKTVNNALSVLSSALKLAKRWKVIDALPCEIELRPAHGEKPEFYDFEDYTALCTGAEKVSTAHDVLVRLGGDAGLRRGEMLALRWSDCDFRRRQIRVEQAAWPRTYKAVQAHGGELFIIKKPKSGKGRVVPMTNALAAALQAHRHLRGELVLCGDDGSMIAGHKWRGVLMQAQRRAGLKADGALHKLRHTFCSHLAMRGAPVKAIQDLAGHASLQTTLRYMHLSPSALDAAIRLLDEPAPVAAVVG